MDCVPPIRAGTRSSRLAVRQSEEAVAFLSREFPDSDWTLSQMGSPGDRDLSTPIESAPGDFFTRDLDEAVLSGAVDCAIHSAKDMPEDVLAGLDWMWLPERGSRLDAIVARKGVLDVPAARPLRVGVSSSRRRAYALSRWPNAELVAMRGAVDARLEYIASGKCDVAIMALAGLDRLGMDLSRFDIIPVPLEELETPEAQGVLAVVFRLGDRRFVEMRNRFAKAVRFVGAGAGDAELITVRGMRDLMEADTVIADALIPDFRVMRQISARWIFAGKRCGSGADQASVTKMILDEVRKGRRVVRLKGGDPGLFGRLAEETSALEAHSIAFTVRPGVSSLLAATTGTGMLLTSRGETRGFRAFSPRSSAQQENEVAFMATGIMDGGTMVYDALGPNEEIVSDFSARTDDRPGIWLNGPCTGRRWPRLGFLKGARVLVTASKDVAGRIRTRVEDLGGVAVMWPMIELAARKSALDGIDVESYDAVVFTSPSAVRCFFEVWRGDVRRLPAVWASGEGSARALLSRGILCDFSPGGDGSAESFASAVKGIGHAVSGKRVLRLKSALASSEVKDSIVAAGAKCVDDAILYDNVALREKGRAPRFDAVHFASASAVRAFIAAYGAGTLDGKEVFVMGEPTRKALPDGMDSRRLP